MNNQVFVSNISWKTSEQILKNFMSSVGEIEKVSIIFDRGSLRSKGYGFVTYKSEADASKAISDLNGKTLDERELLVEKVSPNEVAPESKKPEGLDLDEE